MCGDCEAVTLAVRTSGDGEGVLVGLSATGVGLALAGTHKPKRENSEFNTKGDRLLVEELTDFFICDWKFNARS